MRSWVRKLVNLFVNVAFVKCAGTCENANADYEYYGVEDCSMMAFVPNGGPKKCNLDVLDLVSV